MVEHQYLQISDEGSISSFLDIKTICKDYVAANAHTQQTDMPVLQPINERFPFISCTVSHEICFEIQAKFESLRSNVMPEGHPDNHLFFIIQCRISCLPTFDVVETYQLKRIELLLEKGALAELVTI